MIIFNRNTTAGAEGASQSGQESQNSTAQNQNNSQNSTAQNIPAEIELDLGGEKIKATPDDIKAWKLAHERKTTNADRLLTKKSQELSEKMKVLEQIPAMQEAISNLTAALQNNKSQSQQGSNSYEYESFDDNQGNVDPDKVAEFLVGKVLEQVNPKLSKLDELDKYINQEMPAKEKQAHINKFTSDVLGGSLLQDDDKKLFIDTFIGRHFHELDDLPLEDTYDEEKMQDVKGYKSLLKEELDTFQNMMKARGLLKNKEYANNIANKNKQLGTDNAGSSGMGTGKEENKQSAKSDMQKSRDRISKFTEILKNMEV